ncbi:MAG: hypothetical protein JXR36_02880, partial [Bacteroidales bacterium]|nr:hypothetical protein [Bacteroidales bacterium]
TALLEAAGNKNNDWCIHAAAVKSLGLVLKSEFLGEQEKTAFSKQLESIVTALITAAGDHQYTNWRIRRGAVKTLGLVLKNEFLGGQEETVISNQHESILDALTKAKGDQDSNVREAAKNILQDLNPEKVEKVSTDFFRKREGGMPDKLTNITLDTLIEWIDFPTP